MSCGLAALAEGNTLVGKYQKGLWFDQVGGGLGVRSISLVLSCSGSPGTRHRGSVSALWCSICTSTEVQTTLPQVLFQRVLVVYVLCAPFHPFPPIIFSLKLCCLLLHSGIDTHAPAHQSGMDKVSSLKVELSLTALNWEHPVTFEVCGERLQSCEKGSVNVRSLQEKKKSCNNLLFFTWMMTLKCYSSDVNLLCISSSRSLNKM